VTLFLWGSRLNFVEKRSSKHHREQLCYQSVAKMFAVPGWSVSAKSLKTQTLQPSNPVVNNTVPPKPTNDEPTKSSKKRKRTCGKSKASEVNSTNLADLWETVIEGKPKSKKETSKNKEIGEKRQKVSKDGDLKLKPPTTKEAVAEIIEDPKTKKLKEKKKARKEALALSKDTSTTTIASTEAIIKATLPQPPKPAAQLTPLQAAMRQKLVSARFRHLNQELYTTPSAHSLELFQQNPEMFQEYHEGFRRQVEIWPENPVDGYVLQIKARGMQRMPTKNHGAPETNDSEIVTSLPRTGGTSFIADLGCGDAGLAQGLQKDSEKLKLKIFSYDLQNPSPLVTKADIANLPLEDGSIDLAIFCLALMGTNWIDFIEEAYRILHWKGELWVAEIKSRFGRVGQKRVEHSVGNRSKTSDKKTLKKQEEQGDEADLAVEVDGQVERKQATDVSAFVEVLRKRGFVLQGAPDLKNKMFVKMHFVKGLTPIKGKCVPLPKGMAEMGVETWKKKPKGKFIDDEDKPISSEAGVLKPCVYKLR
jgi:ribosomal RNA-processing protein 8